MLATWAFAAFPLLRAALEGAAAPAEARLLRRCVLTTWALAVFPPALEGVVPLLLLAPEGAALLLLLLLALEGATAAH